MPGERALARERGEKTYFNGNPCKYGHTAMRRTGCGTCMTCYGTYFAKHYQENKESEQAARRRDYEKNTAAYKARAKAQRDAGYAKVWYDNNRGRWKTLMDRRDEDIKRRTPSWANLDKIEAFYDACPEGYTVDHIIPLRGKLVSGFHIHTNLQYLTRSDNSKKHNKFDPMVHEEPIC